MYTHWHWLQASMTKCWVTPDGTVQVWCDRGSLLQLQISAVTSGISPSRINTINCNSVRMFQPCRSSSGTKLCVPDKDLCGRNINLPVILLLSFISAMWNAQHPYWHSISTREHICIYTQHVFFQFPMYSHLPAPLPSLSMQLVPPIAPSDREFYLIHTHPLICFPPSPSLQWHCCPSLLPACLHLTRTYTLVVCLHMDDRLLSHL